MVFYVCTMGHLYGLRRLGHDDLAASSSGVAEVEVQIALPATHERMEGNHSDHGSEDNEEDREVLDEVLERVVEGVVQGVMGVMEEEEAGDIVSIRLAANSLKAAARTVPAGAAEPAATPEHAQADMVELAAAAHAPNAPPAAVNVPSPTSGATSAGSSESASPLPHAAPASHGQLLGAAQTAKDGFAAAPLSTMVDALSLNAHAAAPPSSASSAAASNATAPEE
ncbi:unnamed protein product [Closterium sp. NIES-54]